MGKLWGLIEDWRDGMEFPPSYRQIAKRLDVSQSSFETWKDPARLPEPANLYAISALIGVPYHRVVQAAVDDTKLFDEAQARKSAEAKKSGARARDITPEEFTTSKTNGPKKRP